MKMKALLRAVPILIAVFLLVLAPASVSDAAAKKTKLSKKSITVKYGHTYRLKLKNPPANKTIHWFSDNEDIATVSAKGKVTGKRVGTTNIGAWVVGKKMYRCKVKVTFETYKGLDKKEQAVLKKLVNQFQADYGSKLSEDFLSSSDYTWKNGHLTEIYLNHANLTGKISFRGFSRLKKIIIYYNGLKEIDVSGNPNLEVLDCRLNQLTDLNLGANGKLQELDLSSNNLQRLDVSANKKLKKLNCQDNSINSLLLGEGNSLEELNCAGNRLSELDVSGCQKLTSLNCRANDVSELNLNSNAELEELNCGSNPLLQLDVSKNTKLTWLYCDYTKLSELNLDNNMELEGVIIYGLSFPVFDMSGHDKCRYIRCSKGVVVISNHAQVVRNGYGVSRGMISGTSFSFPICSKQKKYDKITCKASY